MTVSAESFAELGFATVPGVLSPRMCEAISRRIRTTSTSRGSRNLLDKPWCIALVERLRRHPGVAELLPGGHVAIQCTYFEKSAARNWTVAAHQDLSVPVATRVEGPALQGWSVKEDSTFVQPPDPLLRQLVAVRVHLDPCGALDGPLRVVPRSHRLGRLAHHEVVALRRAATEQVCLADVGASLVMHPLLVHASSRSRGDGRRRVLHVLFGPRDAGYGLQWRTATKR